MSITAGQNALIERLQGMSGRPDIAYLSGPTVTDLPRIVIQIPRPAKRTKFLDGDTEADTEIIARVEVEDELARYRPHILATSCETPPEPQQPSIRRSHSAMQFAKRGAHNEI